MTILRWGIYNSGTPAYGPMPDKDSRQVMVMENYDKKIYVNFGDYYKVDGEPFSVVKKWRDWEGREQTTYFSKQEILALKKTLEDEGVW